MKKSVSRLAFVVCALVFIVVLVTDLHQLPGRIASHFDGHGEANGWISAAVFAFSTAAVGLGIPVFIIASMFAVRFCPPSLLNVPRPEYWRAPRNFRRACDYLLDWAFWFGCGFVLWQTAFAHLIVASNRVSLPQLDGGRLMLLTVTLLVFCAAWVGALIVRFCRIDPPDPVAGSRDPVSG